MSNLIQNLISPISNSILTINGVDDNKPLIEFKRNGEVYYNHQGIIKKVEEREEILTAFKYCVLGYTGKEIDDALFDAYLNKFDNEILTNKQIVDIEKRIRKIKLKKINKNLK